MDNERRLVRYFVRKR